MSDEPNETTDDSRRDFMKKGTLAATALAVGGGAAVSMSGATAQEDDEEGEVVIQGRDYFPEGEFEVLTEFETATRLEFLESLDEDEDVFTDPDDWDVYAIKIEVGGPGGQLGYLMVDDNEIDPDPGDTGTMDESASFRDPEWNLLEMDVTIEPDDDNDDNDDNDDDVDDEEDDVDDEEDDVDDEENDLENEDEEDDGF